VIDRLEFAAAVQTIIGTEIDRANAGIQQLFYNRARRSVWQATKRYIHMSCKIIDVEVGQRQIKLTSQPGMDGIQSRA
jgi:hypothetical protein